MDSLLLEIGTEEIPAGYIGPALAAMSRELAERLSRARIRHGELNTFGTPRRLAVLVREVAPNQEAMTETLVGPPVRVAIDGNGGYTVPAVKFAEKAGVSLEELRREQTEKGEYLVAVRTETPRPSRELLPEILQETLRAIPFPKSMRWADRPMAFARPVHSLTALLGSRKIPVSFNGIQSGKKIQGHFFMQAKPIPLTVPEDYEKLLSNAWVVPDPEKRKRIIEKEVEERAKNLGGVPLPDDRLLAEVTNLVEYPVAVGGRFGEKFLEIPRPVLITAMAKHQKYFSVVDENGELLPCFVAVNNTPARDAALTTRGHERVLRARLSDARFFFEADREHRLEDRAEKLSGVLFQAALGTMLEKTGRLEDLAGFIAERMAPGDMAVKAHAARAARLCKVDLVSEVVGEFPELQGIMGRIYALADGEAEPVATAVEEHYRPIHAGGRLPETPEGSALACADKLDSLCGCFAVGLVPTGASDPYALRRQAIGMVLILLERGRGVSLGELVDRGISLVADKATQDLTETRKKILAFLSDRMIQMLVERGNPRDIVAAAAAAGTDNVPELWERTRALSRLKDRPDFQELAAAFKRVVNIIRQAREKGEYDKSVAPDPGLFENACEGELLSASSRAREEALGLLETGDVEGALRTVASLKPSVDDFFDGVLVMDPDPAKRANRLALLGEIAGLFARFADFSRIST
ncbi:MAG: glycine--tRNA ligase subunit beta [Pseudomonadota bacterium]